MGKCSVNCYGECQRKVYVDDKCILHCSKNDYSKDWNSGLLFDFYNEFINYIIKQLFEHRELLDDKYSQNEIATYLKSNRFKNDEYNEVLKKSIFIPSCIHFPARDERDTFDYLKILNLFGQIHFNYCEFYISRLDLKNVECFFQDCKFHDRWTLYDYGVLENEDNVIYQTCEFDKTVSNYIPEKSKELAIYRHSQFDYTCQFKKSIEFDRCKFENMLFNTNQHNYLEKNTIKLLKFEHSTFEKKFQLNNYDIEEFICEDSIFKSKFEFKENKLINFRLYNSNFNGISDLYGCIFQKFNIEKSIFNDFAGFENCIFGTHNQLNEELAIFKYATFKDSLNVRNSKFLSGLDIKYINLYGEANFLDSIIESTDMSTRDTFRRLKHEADKIGNIIEANKHYQKEMEEREKELKKALPKSFLEWIVFKIHDISSKHSQDWVLALYWIIVITFLYSHLKVFWCQENTEYYIIPFVLNILILTFVLLEIAISKNLNIIYKAFSGLIIYFIYAFITKDVTLECFSNNINPFSIMTGHDTLNFSTLIYKIIIAYLLYQFIVSVRQNTRRK